MVKCSFYSFINIAGTNLEILYSFANLSDKDGIAAKCRIFSNERASDIPSEPSELAIRCAFNFENELLNAWGESLRKTTMFELRYMSFVNTRQEKTSGSMKSHNSQRFTCKHHTKIMRVDWTNINRFDNISVSVFGCTRLDGRQSAERNQTMLRYL